MLQTAHRTFWTLLAAIFLFHAGPCLAAAPPDMGGWAPDGAYNRSIPWKEPDRFKGIVIGLKEIVPLPGMSPGVALLVRESDFVTVTVHVGPKWYLRDMDLPLDQTADIRGVWIKIKGRDVLIASKIKVGENYNLKVRLNRDGTPLWAGTVDSSEETDEEMSEKTPTPDLTGWEKDSPYNRRIKWEEPDKFKGTIVGIKEITPLPGMSPGIALLVSESDYVTVTLHLGPKSYLGDIGLHEGDTVILRGVWTSLDGEPVAIASKVKKGDNYELKVRLTSDGTPFWTMTPEELAAAQKEP